MSGFEKLGNVMVLCVFDRRYKIKAVVVHVSEVGSEH
jgi:hypothetical protein